MASYIIVYVDIAVIGYKCWMRSFAYLGFGNRLASSLVIVGKAYLLVRS